MMQGKTAFVAAWALGLSLSCQGQMGDPGTPGDKGDKGDKGDTGAMGAPGNAAATHPDCPIGYSRDQSAANIVLCKMGADEVVRVGTGGAAFWIDRYEASVWNQDGSTQYGAMMDNYPSATFPDTGQATVDLFAFSRSGVTPSRFITWFQANEACAAAGKRLPTGSEWLRAARGTQDRGATDGQNGDCRTNAASPRLTGLGSANCVSKWGAEDMIGNLWEMTNEWYAGVGNNTVRFENWPAAFNGDTTVNVTGSVYADNTTIKDALPASLVRGGGYADGTRAGIFAMYLAGAPSSWDGAWGFRCVVPR